MKDKILILAIYPAPYRMELCAYAAKCFSADVFFESGEGDSRDSRWFQKGEYSLLDTQKGREEYESCLLRIREYGLVVVYDYSTREGRRLIAKCKKDGVPYVVNCDGVIATNKRNFIKDFIKKQLLKKATAYLASGRLAKEYFMRYGAREEEIYFHTFSSLHEGEVLEKPLSREEKKEIRERLKLPTDKKIAIAVGRFIPLKNYDRLIKAWKEIENECYLLLIGGGEELENYQSIIKEYDVKNILIEGFHPKEELYEYYKAADVFIHSSSYEAWGLVVNEAMAHGLPIVISNNCTVGRELIEEGKNGYLYPTFDEEVGVKKLSTLLKDEELYEQAAKFALETIRPYTIENMAKTHVEVFEKILKSEVSGFGKN